MTPSQTWDCIVIGAGPAGALAAQQVANSGYTVLLVDKNSFPRYKVCGCCINGAAQEALAEAGLLHVLNDNNAVPLQQLHLFDGKQNASIRLPAGVSLSRRRFDAALIDSATKTGVTVFQNTTATVLASSESIKPETTLPPRLVRLQTSDWTTVAETKLVIVADGLAGNSLNELAEFEPSIEKHSRFGAGVVLDEGPSFYKPGKIYMICGTGGYVGLVRLEDDRIDVAAAFDQAFSRESHGPSHAAANLIESCSLPVPDELRKAHWSGTQPLSRTRRKIGAHRLLVIGDAAGYPEPFTGEGIAWALWSGLLSARLAVNGIAAWHPQMPNEWNAANKRFQRQRFRSRLIATGLRNDDIRRFMLNIISNFPRLASPVVQQINRAHYNSYVEARTGFLR